VKTNDKFRVGERTVDLTNTKDRTGAELTEEIEQKIQSDICRLCNILSIMVMGRIYHKNTM
jgi:hypothetical protein